MKTEEINQDPKPSKIYHSSTPNGKIGKEEAQKLLDSILPFAETMLAKYGEFHPYGGATTPKGDIINIGADDGKGDKDRQSSDLIDFLQKGLRAGAEENKYTSTAVVYDVVVKLPSNKQSDAIAVNLDHKLGYSAVVYLPYKLENGKVEFGEMQLAQGAGDIFRM